MNTDDSLNHTGELQLRDFLANRGMAARIHRPGVPMPTVPLAAAAIGVREEQIIKSVLFQDKQGAVVLGIASGAGRIDRAMLAAAAGLSKLKLAPPEVVLASTGYPAGGVAPVGHRTVIPVVIDRRVMALETVFGGGGSEATLLEIDPRAIAECTGATVADILEGGVSAAG